MKIFTHSGSEILLVRQIYYAKDWKIIEADMKHVDQNILNVHHIYGYKLIIFNDSTNASRYILYAM